MNNEKFAPHLQGGIGQMLKHLAGLDDKAGVASALNGLFNVTTFTEVAGGAVIDTIGKVANANVSVATDISRAELGNGLPKQALPNLKTPQQGISV